ncbi:hypothetical protein AAC387_Pa04g0801 [Persea americana]
MHSYTSTNSSISLQFPSKLRFQNNSPSKHHHFSTLLQSCNNLPHLKQIHAQLLKSALNLNSPHAARLISFYSSFKSFSYARRVFDTDKEKTIFVWNAIIRAYSMSLLTHQDALHMFVLMLCCCSDDGFVGANEFTYPYLLKCCDSLQEGRQIHAHIFKSFWGLDANVFVCAALIDMYVRCGLLNSDARRVFDKMPERDGVCWNTMISGYSKAGDYEMVLSLFRKMLEDVGVEPTSTTIVNVLSACGEVGALAEGRWIHRFMERKDEMNIFIKTALITMYSKCGDILAARGIFDQCLQRDLVLWSAMMSGYGINGHGLEALKLFRLMEKEAFRFVLLRSSFVVSIGFSSSVKMAEVEIKTAPADFRFPTTNQTRHCFTRYIEYHRCMAAKADTGDCQKFAKYYRSLCPGEWVEKWNEQRENGVFPGPL